MAEKISVQIALEGGAEIERQLADIGKAGQQAFQQIASAAEKGSGFRNLDPQVLTDAYKKFGVTAAAEINKIQGALQAAVNLERLASGVQSLEGYFERVGTAAKALGDSLTKPLADAANRMLSILGPLGGIARALGPVGIAAGAAFGSMVKGAFDAAASINELSAAAMKLNVPTQQLHKFQLGMEAAGISAKAIAGGLEQVNSLVEKSQIDRVANSLKELQDAATRGFGAHGTQQLRDLQAAAEKVGPAGEAARKALETLGLPIPGAGARDIKELGIELARLRGLGVDIKVDDTAVTAIQKMIAAVQKMPDGMQRSALAIKLFGETAGPELVAAMRTGSLAVDQFTQRYTQLTKQQELEAARFEQSQNKLTSTWQRFNSLTFSPAMRFGFDWLQKEIVAIQNDLIGLGRDLTKFGQAAALVWNDPIAALGHLIGGIGRLASAWANSPLGGAGGATFNEWLAETGAFLTEFIASAQRLIAQWVTTPVGGAWQWIVDTFNSVVGFFGGLIGQAQGLIAAWVTTPVGGAWQWIIDTFNSALGMLSGAIATATGLITQWVTTPIASAWQWIVDAWNAMLAKLGLKGGAAAEAPAAGGQGFAGGGWVGGRGSGTSDSNLAWVSRGEYITPARVVQQPGVLAFLEALRRSGNLHRALSGAPRFAAGGLIPSYATGGPVNAASIGPKLQQVFEIMKQGLQIGWSGAEQAFKSLNQISTGILRAANATDQALFGVGEALLKNMESVDKTLLQGMNILKGLADSIGVQRRAGGGLLGGRGTGTSDSNLAWVSRGEYITPARAVQQPGVLAFLEALRRSGGNLRELLDGMGHFALGGMVRTPLPSFAGGGGGMSNVTIQFPGLPEITGLRASSGVVDELRKAAALAQVRSGGRKPSRYS